MTAIDQLIDCDGFLVDGYAGRLGVVEETWLDERGLPAALAVRREHDRALLLASDVIGVDADDHDLFVRPGARLLELEPPRLSLGDDGLPVASWRTTGTLVAPDPTGTDDDEGVPWRIGLRVAAALAVIAAVEIGLAFLVPYLVTGHAY